MDSTAPLSPTGCVLAYHGLVIDKSGTIMPCCQYAAGSDPPKIKWHDQKRYHADLRLSMHGDFMLHRSHSGCQKCYREESLAATSLRNHASMWYGKQYQLDQHAAIFHLELRLGNLCNLKCMMCYPGASSALAAERRAHEHHFRSLSLARARMENIEPWWEQEDFIQWFHSIIGDVRHLHMTGGEPLLIPQVADFVAVALARSPNIEIGLNTNATVLPDRILDVLLAAPRLRIAISLEGTEAMNDYVRYPSDWPSVDHNIQTIKSSLPNADLSVNHTVQHASVYSLPSLYDYCQTNHLPITLNTVQGIPFLEWSSVPAPDIRNLEIWLSSRRDLDPKFTRFLNNLIGQTTFDPLRYQEFRNYVAVLDRIRGTSWDVTFKPTSVDTDLNLL